MPRRFSHHSSDEAFSLIILEPKIANLSERRGDRYPLLLAFEASPRATLSRVAGYIQGLPYSYPWI